MWNNRMASFRSAHYPTGRSTFVITQEYAMRYYLTLLFIVLVIGVIRSSKGFEVRDMTIFVAVSVLVSLFIGNVLAKAKLRRSIAEIFFVNDGFSIISVHDILHQSPKRSFPLKFANPRRTQDEIEFHWEDQIMTLRREDWGDEFDLIWNWLISGSVEMGAAPGLEDLD